MNYLLKWIKVKILTKINFHIEKVIFIVSYVKDINQYIEINTENPFFEKFHLLKYSLTKLKKLKIWSKEQIPWNEWRVFQCLCSW